MQCNEVSCGRIPQRYPMGELDRQEPRFVMLRDSLNGMVTWMIRLDDDGTPDRSGPCEIDGIEKGMIRSLRGTKIWNGQPCVSLHYADDANRRNDSPPKEKLGSDKEIPLTPVHFLPGDGGLRRTLHRIPIDAEHPRRRKQPSCLFLDPFRSLADYRQTWPGTGRTSLGHKSGAPAVRTGEGSSRAGI